MMDNFGHVSVAVLLAVYNGEKFLKKQIESLLSQTFSEFTIFVRDDGSSDRSKEILEYFARMQPNRFVILPCTERLGARGSFAFLMEACNADYVFFCDQDDVWLPDKVEIGIGEIIRLENIHGDGVPILLHTDLVVVDAALNVIHESFVRYQNLNPHYGAALNKMLVQNIATGCTMGINRALLRLASPVPREAVMHDWWIALVASTFGVMGYLPKPTVLYRQHGHNEKGAKAWNVSFILKVLTRNLLGCGEIGRSLHDTRSQAAVFQRRFYDQLDPVSARLLHDYVHLDEYSYIERRMVLVRHGMLKHGFARNIGLMFYV